MMLSAYWYLKPFLRLLPLAYIFSHITQYIQDYTLTEKSPSLQDYKSKRTKNLHLMQL